MSCKVDNKFFTAGTSTYMKLCGHPKIDVESDLSFLNLIVIRNHDAKISVSFVTRCGVSAVLRFSYLRSGLVQTTVIFQKPFALTREIIATKISR